MVGIDDILAWTVIGSSGVNIAAQIVNYFTGKKDREQQDYYLKEQNRIQKLGFAEGMADKIDLADKEIAGWEGSLEQYALNQKQAQADFDGIKRWTDKKDEFGNIDEENGVSDWARYADSERSSKQAQITSMEMNSQNAANTASNQIAQYDRWLGNYGDMYAQQVQSKQASIDSMTANRQAHVNSANNEVAQLDRWLDNYGDMYAQQVQSKQAQTDTLVAGGKETYENFLNAIGYADAAAGASGRTGAGTSSSHVTKMLDQKLVDYVGEDRTLDENGGLFGSQLTAANMEMSQLKTNLERQRMDALGNKKTILDNLAITGWAHDSQMKAAGMEMGQLKAGLEIQRQNVLGDWSTTAANAANAQTAYGAQLDAMFKEMGVMEINLRNNFDDMVTNQGILTDTINMWGNTIKNTEDGIKSAKNARDANMRMYESFVDGENMVNIFKYRKALADGDLKSLSGRVSLPATYDWGT
jgi:hypothetical protein